MIKSKIKTTSKSLLFILFLLQLFNVVALGQSAVPGAYLVQFHQETSPQQLQNRLESKQRKLTNQTAPTAGEIRNGNFSDDFTYQLVSKSRNIWLLEFAEVTEDYQQWLSRQPEVVIAQLNHLLSSRNNALPNDPLFPQQWQYQNDGSNGGLVNADIDADLAWNISTGGVSMAGDTIVVAVIDGGVQQAHPDLVQNLWINRQEIPNDGIDNDNNGYIDDYRGWNVFAQNDNIQGIGSAHGTPVSGIIGAAGNNNTGVTGVNWKVKIMFIAGGNTEADMLAAYEYVLNARKQYNESGGSAGAFVVAVNCSWGIDYGNPANAPLWCGAFEQLGATGVLSVAATANNPVNVDIEGDLPTTCPSDYLISVTSLNNADQKAPNAAWGPVNIDLGAYGEGILTTKANSQYAAFSGTSFAAPHVAGAIGLLYSAPCTELIATAKVNPELAAILAKELLLSSTTPNNALENKTLSNGRLNLFGLLEEYQGDCANCSPPFALKTNQVSPYSSELSWTQAANNSSVSLRWRATGTSTWTVIENISSPYLLENLAPCNNYEYALRGTCANNETSEWSPALSFMSLGCCSAPAFTWSVNSLLSSATIVWSLGNDFNAYKVFIKKKNSSNWGSYVVNLGPLFITDLDPCTAYDIKIQGWCLDSWVTLLPAGSFETQGCGSCLEANYCVSSALAAEEEWIAAVKVGNWEFESGTGGGGYQDLTGEQTSRPQISPLGTYDLSLTPGFWGSSYKEYFKLFIDYNLDGDFNDPGELAFDPGFAKHGVVEGDLMTPAFSTFGVSRMRVVMKYIEDDQILPEACGVFSFGQVEDYCIELVDLSTNAKASTDSVAELKIYPQPASNAAWIEVPGSNAISYDLNVWDITGRKQLSESLSPLRNKGIYLDTSYWPSGIYIVSIESSGKLFRGKLLKH